MFAFVYRIWHTSHVRHKEDPDGPATGCIPGPTAHVAAPPGDPAPACHRLPQL